MLTPLSARRLFTLLLLGAALLSPHPGFTAMDHHFIFFPDRQLVATPAAAGLAYEEVWFPAADGVKLHGWYVPGEPGRPLTLFFHGNAGNISHRIDNLLLFRRLGLAVLIFDYRGYGRSEGRTSEQGTYSDARGALIWLQQRGWQPQQLIYFGRSLGAGVAVQLATETPPGALVLETPFPSIAAMGWHHNPILYLLLGWLLDARYDSFNKIGRIHAPLLLFQGDRDSIVPEKMARRLFERANQPKTYYRIEGADHNDTFDVGGERYWQQWRQFLERQFPLQPANP